MADDALAAAVRLCMAMCRDTATLEAWVNAHRPTLSTVPDDLKREANAIVIQRIRELKDQNRP